MAKGIKMDSCRKDKMRFGNRVFNINEITENDEDEKFCSYKDCSAKVSYVSAHAKKNQQY
jgi:hypothetical protein